MKNETFMLVFSTLATYAAIISAGSLFLIALEPEYFYNAFPNFYDSVFLFSAAYLFFNVWEDWKILFKPRPAPLPVPDGVDVLQQLAIVSRQRCGLFGHSFLEWSAADYATQVSGELGELCNLLKKQRRGDKFDRDGKTPIDNLLLGKEAADVVISLDLLCQRLGIDLRQAVVQKFNETSDAKKTDLKIKL